MSFKPYFETVNYSYADTTYTGVLPFGMYGFDGGFDVFSMPLFAFSGYSPLPSYYPHNNSIWAGYSFGDTSSSKSSSYAPETKFSTSKTYDFGSLTSNRSSLPVVDTSFNVRSVAPETSIYTQRTVTPTQTGKYKRPKSFKSTEAQKYWEAFSSKASQFNPKTDLGPEFLAKVKKIAGEVGCEYRDLLALMQIESGLNPYAPNLAGYGAYGLIQFQPNTLRGMGYQPEDLLTMSPVEQLDLVKKHLITTKKAKGLSGKLSAGQLYGLVLAPGYVNDAYFYKTGSRGYNANANLDKVYGNNNGKIEKSDLAACISANRVNENIFVA